MDLSTVARACLRRFYVLVLVLGLAGYAAVQLYDDAAPQYSVSSNVVIVQSPSLTLVRADGPSANPYSAGAGSTTLATLLADTLSTRTVQSTILPAGSALVAQWDAETSQLVALTAVSDSAAGAQDAMGAVLAQAGPILNDIQVRAGAPVDQLYTVSTGSPVDFPVLTYPDRLRMVVATALAGLLVAVVLAMVLDSLLLRRRAARHSASSAQATEERGSLDDDELVVPRNERLMDAGEPTGFAEAAGVSEPLEIAYADPPTVMHRWDDDDRRPLVAARVQGAPPPLPPLRRRGLVQDPDRE